MLVMRAALFFQPYLYCSAIFYGVIIKNLTLPYLDFLVRYKLDLNFCKLMHLSCLNGHTNFMGYYMHLSLTLGNRLI